MKGLRTAMLLLVILLGALPAGGCGGTDPMTPPDLRWQEDTCDFCRMVIEDRRFAAGYRLQTGEARRFDDIGDMVLYLAHEQEPVASQWVRDYAGDRWLAAEKAWIVEAASIESPMGYGLLAVATEKQARDLAGEHGGTVLTWQELRARGVRSPRGQ